MFLRGTSSRSKTDISNDIESMGARLQVETGREISSYGLQVFKGDVNRAVRLLGDMISNSTISGSELELVKEEVH